MRPVTDQAAWYRYVVLGVLFLHFTFNYLDRQILGILAVPVKSELHLSDTQLGLLGGLAFSLIYCTAAIPVAYMADRASRRAIISAALFLWSLFTALSGLAGNFIQLLLCRVGVGIGEAGAQAPSYSLIADYFPPSQRARAFSLYHLGLPIGSALGLFLGGVIAVEYGWRTAFIAVGLTGTMLAPLVWFIVKEPVRGGMEAEPAAVLPVAPSLGEVFALLKRKPSFWLLAFGTACGAMQMYGMSFWMPTFLQRSHGFSLHDTALLLAILTFVGGGIGALSGGWLGDRFGGRDKRFYALVPAIASLATLPFFLAALWVENSALLFFLLLVPQACGIFASSPVAVALQHLAPATMRATTVAFYVFIANFIGMSVSTFLLGRTSDWLAPSLGSESLRYSLLGAGALLYPTIALLFFFASRRLDSDWYRPPALGPS
jgi:MFS family permease